MLRALPASAYSQGGLGPPADFEGWSEIPRPALYLELVKTQSLVLDFIIRNVRIFPIQVLSSSHLQREKNYVVSSHVDFVWNKMADVSGTLSILNEKNNRNPRCLVGFVS